jgi:hypothetical protein
VDPGEYTFIPRSRCLTTQALAALQASQVHKAYALAATSPDGMPMPLNHNVHAAAQPRATNSALAATSVSSALDTLAAIRSAVVAARISLHPGGSALAPTTPVSSTHLVCLRLDCDGAGRS